MNKPYKITKAHLVVLQQKFKTDSAIAKDLHVTRWYIKYLRKRYGMSIVKASDSKVIRNSKILTLYENGAKATSLAEEFQLSLPAIYKILRRLKNDPDVRLGVSKTVGS